jgi:DNA-directed RNA polymerase III subunit RPC6
VAALASKLYEECRNKFSADHLFYQKDLLSLGVVPNDNLPLLVQCAQSLVDKKLLRLLSGKDGRLAWKIISQEDAEKFQNLTADESLVYNVIHSTGRSGIWQREITTRTNLTATILSRCLKSLEGKNYIKKIRNVKQTGKIIYMLAELTPSEDVTGGAWFTDGVLDSNFIKILAYFIEFFVSRKSWYEVSTTTDPHKHRNKRQKISGSAAKLDLEKQYLPYPAGYQGYPTVPLVAAEVNKSGITPVNMVEESIGQLLEMLCYDNKLVALENGQFYKAVKKPNEVKKPKELCGVEDLGLKQGDDANDTKEDTAEDENIMAGRGGMTEAPCGQCPVFKLCTPGGAVSPETCKYFDSWLEKTLGF